MVRPVITTAAASAKAASVAARMFVGRTARTYATSPDFSGYREIDVDAFARAKDLAAAVVAHPAARVPFLESELREYTEAGLTSAQMDCFSTNYLYRTARTAITAMRVMEDAIKRGDYKLAGEINRIVNDEMGGRDSSKTTKEQINTHLELLHRWINIFRNDLFELPVKTIREITHHDVLPEVYDFRRGQEWLVRLVPLPPEGAVLGTGEHRIIIPRQSEAVSAGCFLAHEKAADGMLRHLLDGLCEPLRGHFSPERYSQAVEYFAVHIDTDKVAGENVEEEHGESAIKNAASVIADAPISDRAAVMADIRLGMDTFLRLQAGGFAAISAEMGRQKNNGKKLMPKPLLPDVPSPAPGSATGAAVKPHNTQRLA